MLESLLYLMTSFWLGAVHAATPGHGKTIAASYIVGARGRPVDAVVLGVFVTLSHTSGIVLVAALATLGSAWLMPQRVETYLAMGTGILVIAIGGWMLATQMRLLRRGDAGALDTDRRSHDHGLGDHDHDHPDHDHDHPQDHDHTHHAQRDHEHSGPPNHDHEHLDHGDDHEHRDHTRGDPEQTGHRHPHEHRPHFHSHGWGPAHSHDMEALARSRPSLSILLGLGIAGGLLPDPGALAILLSAIASGKLILGLATVLVFSLGFASVLVLVGVVAARVGWLVLNWLSSRWISWVQVGAALLILSVGLVLTANAWRSLAVIW